MSDHNDPGQYPWEDPRHGIQAWQSNPEPWQASEESAATPTHSPDYVECWRCGKLGIKDLDACIYCRAPLTRGTLPRRETRRWSDGRDSTQLVRVILVFMGLLGSLIVFILLQMHQAEGLPEQEVSRRVLKQMLIFGLIDTLLIGLAWAWVGLPMPLPSPPAIVRGVAWAAAAPVLLLALGLNVLYHLWLRDFLKLPAIEPNFRANKELLGLAVLAVCVQPAVVEEFFFRYLAINTLRTATSTHGAVLISSIMFGMAHIGNPLGIPYLIVLGMVLGYARVASGNLFLPMLMHFGHNLAVLFIP
jgi:membrane protease YdiL (CAAX protease family)